MSDDRRRLIPHYLRKTVDPIDPNAGFESGGQKKNKSAWESKAEHEQQPAETGQKKNKSAWESKAEHEQQPEETEPVSQDHRRRRVREEEDFVCGLKKKKKEETVSHVCNSQAVPWDQHSNFVASKLMDKMGYIKGQGLGAQGQGMLYPIDPQQKTWRPTFTKVQTPPSSPDQHST